MNNDGVENVTLGRLLYNIAKIWRAKTDQSLQLFGLSRAKWNVIMALDGEDAAGLPQIELARQCGVEPPSIANLLDRMEKEGWVERRACKDDRRSKRTLLTDKAKAIRQEINEVSRQVEEEVFACMSPDTYDQIKYSLLELHSALEQTALSENKDKLS